MVIKLFNRITILSVLYLFWSGLLFLSYAQVYNQDQLQISTTPILINKIKINNTGANYLKTKPSLAAELSIGYYKAITKHLGATLSAGYGFTTVNVLYNAELQLPDDPPKLIEDEFWEGYQLSKHIGIAGSYLYPMHTRIRLEAQVGLKFYFFTGIFYSLGASSPGKTYPKQFPFFIMELDHDTKRLYTAYIGKLGASYILNKRMDLGASIIYNYFNKPLATDTFYFANTVAPSSGTASYTPSFAGLEMRLGWKMR
jgi:uncharacterized protein Usg